MASSDKLVSDYLVETAPEEIVEGLRQLAGAEYPIDDAPSLREQLKEGEQAESLLSHLEAQDFPLVGARNAFDKLRARVRQLSDRPGLPPLMPPPELPPDRVERPAVRDIFYDTFGPYCGSQAYAAYSDAVRGGRGDLAAIIVGHQEGKRCQAELSRHLRDWFLAGGWLSGR